MDDRMKPFTVRATARSVKRRNTMLRVGLIVLLILVLLLGTTFALSSFVNKAGNFTVWISDEDVNLITLSDTADFTKCATLLEADIIPQMDNITKDWMPSDLAEIDGCHNGEHSIYLLPEKCRQ